MSRVPLRPAIGLAIVAVMSLLAMLVLPALAGEVAGVTYGGDTRVEFSYEGVLLPCDVGDETYTVRGSAGGDAENNDTIGLDVTVEENLKTEFAAVSVTIEDLTGGSYIFNRSCPEIRAADIRLFEFSRVLLTKVVDGDGEADPETTFTVEVACDQSGDTVSNSPWTRDFDATGGSSQVVFYAAPAATCNISETADGGADAVTVDPETLDYDEEEGDDLGDGSSTVTNTFNPAPEPSPEPTPTPTPTPDVADTVQEAEPAEAVEADADFTG